MHTARHGAIHPTQGRNPYTYTVTKTTYILKNCVFRRPVPCRARCLRWTCPIICGARNQRKHYCSNASCELRRDSSQNETRLSQEIEAAKLAVAITEVEHHELNEPIEARAKHRPSRQKRQVIEPRKPWKMLECTTVQNYMRCDYCLLLHTLHCSRPIFRRTKF